jgi:hypothetical protein
MLLVAVLAGTAAWAEEDRTMDTVKHLGDFPVIELRRYTLHEGAREAFARAFEAYFLEAFEQLGALVLGEFAERAKSDHFLWLRGYHDVDARARICGEFYYGPLWKEHRERINELIVDNDDVLLLKPVRADAGVPALPAVDVVHETGGARGIIVAQLFRLEAGGIDAFLAAAAPAFAEYARLGARPVGLLETLDVPNNFPQLPVRTDGPYVVWLGLVKDESALAAVTARASALARVLGGTAGLRKTVEWIELDPYPRSRLRWR